MSTAYSAEEEALIKNNYRRIGLAGMLKLMPHRTPAGIQSKAKELGLRKHAKRRFWSAEEDAVIRQHYKQGGAEACKPYLPGRSRSSIQNRAWNLHQRDRAKPGPAQKKFLSISRQSVRRTTADEFSEHVHRSWLPVGAWRIDHPTAVRSVFELGAV